MYVVTPAISGETWQSWELRSLQSINSNIIDAYNRVDGIATSEVNNFNSVNVKLNSIQTTVNSILTGQGSNINGSIDQIINAISSAFNNTYDEISGIVSDILASAGNIFGQAYNDIAATMTGIWDGAKSLYSDYNIVLGDTISQLNDSITATLNESVATVAWAAQKSEEYVTNTWSNAKDFVDSGVQSINNFVGQALDDFSMSLNTLYHDVQTSISAATDIKPEEVQNIITGIFDTYDKAFNTLKQRQGLNQ
jgi:phage-related protein